MIDQLIEILEKEVEKLGSRSQLANVLGDTRAGLNRIMDKQSSPSIAKVEIYLQALGYEASFKKKRKKK